MSVICGLCGDEVYDGELYRGRVEGGDPPLTHKWCFYMRLGLKLCERSMDARRRKGLPTPTSPTFHDPRKPSN